MKIEEMIRKWNIKLAEQNGQVDLKISGKTTSKQLAELKDAKPEIIVELQRREAERAEQEAQRKTEQDAEKQAIISGEKPIQLWYHDGEYLSGWETAGQSTEIMKELRLVKYVDGWGYLVESKTIEALGGPEFTYQQAAELAKVRDQVKEAKRQEKEAARQAKFDEARITGKPVLLRQWSADCCSRNEECSTDIHCEYAMPDGSTKHEWNHTW